MSESLQQRIEKIRTDVQAILTVLGRRLIDPKRERPDQHLDLDSTHLQNANLVDANMQHAFLEKANLQGAFLGRANLQGALLIEANLQGASLIKANLQDAGSLTPDQIRSAKSWERATFSDGLREALGLPPNDPVKEAPQ
ncbi:MAG TPA: pentapeptide repeat-containing protein [Edaphobacter sp.]